uniref:Uncharacterized protein n=1 Tax=Vannella robusta TaxID=1487602 RepID=A0A7S4IW38_9EUKA|mmetsp:Transcript_9676/g.11972  ORF Transcript_9676/g.11972 Transcript_9676/m.11972 type:complete len:111 (+) Transcript_9676:22-354(+)
MPRTTRKRPHTARSAKLPQDTYRTFAELPAGSRSSVHVTSFDYDTIFRYQGQAPRSPPCLSPLKRIKEKILSPRSRNEPRCYLHVAETYTLHYVPELDHSGSDSDSSSQS